MSSTRRRSAPVLIVVGLSLLAPFCALVWFAFCEISLGSLTVTYSDFQGELKAGELWFTEVIYTGSPFYPGIEFQTNRLELRTGIVSKTNLPSLNQRRTLVWVGDNLYVWAAGSIYHMADKTFVALPQIPTIGATIFEFEGELAAIVPTTDDGFQLTHWRDGKWIPGRRIALPPPDSVWQRDPQSNRITFSARNLDGRALYSWKNSGRLVVEHQGQQYHLMIHSPMDSFAAYRLGFQFIDETVDGASALSPENAPREPDGWEPIAGDLKNVYWNQMSCDRNGPLFLSNYPRHRLIRRTADGNWSNLPIEDYHGQSWHGAAIVASPSESDSYLIQWDGAWAAATICQIDGQTILPTHVSLPGFKHTYVWRWVRIFAELFCVWMIHVSILSIGASRVSRRGPAVFEAANRQATLAPLHRRTAAMLIDVLLIYGLICLTSLGWRHYFFNAPSVWNPPNYDNLSISLRNLESVLDIGDGGFSSKLTRFFDTPIGWLFRPFDPNTGFFGAMMAIAVLIAITKIFVEGRYGITPGKWLMSIRTLGSQLKPCGFARVLVRDIFRAVDFPLMLTPLLAATSLMNSENRQRFGDRIPDTVVVMANSVRENEHHDE